MLIFWFAAFISAGYALRLYCPACVKENANCCVGPFDLTQVNSDASEFRVEFCAGGQGLLFFLFFACNV